MSHIIAVTHLLNFLEIRVKLRLEKHTSVTVLTLKCAMFYINKIAK